MFMWANLKNACGRHLLNGSLHKKKYGIYRNRNKVSQHNNVGNEEKKTCMPEFLSEMKN